MVPESEVEANVNESRDTRLPIADGMCPVMEVL